MNMRNSYKYFEFALIDKFLAFKNDLKGLSGVEFALIAPMLVSVYLGVAETAMGVTNSRKVSRVAATLSDLVAQSENITANQVDNIINASRAVMAPYSADPLKIYVVGVQIDENGNASVVWSRASSNATAPSVGSSYPIPERINVNNTFLIVTNVTYEYTPAIGGGIINTISFDEKNYNAPRTSATVEFTG